MAKGRSLGESVFRHPCDCQMVRFVANAIVVSAGFDGHFRVWDVQAGTRLCGWSVEGEELYAVESVSEGRYVCGGLKGKVYFLERQGDKCRLTNECEVPGYLSFLVVCGSHGVIAAGSSTGAVCFIETNGSGKIIRSMEFEGQLCGLQWLADEKKLVVGVADGSVWLVEMDGTRLQLFSADTSIEHAEISEVGKCCVIISTDLEFRSDEMIRTHSVLVYRLDESEWKLTNSIRLPDSPNRAYAGCSPNGELLIVVSNHEITHFHLASSTFIRKISVDSHGAAISYSPDGLLYAAGSHGAVFHCWTLSGAELHPPTGHTEAVTMASFSTAESCVYSAATSPEVSRWDLASATRSMALSRDATSLLELKRIDPNSFAVSYWTKSGADIGTWNVTSGAVKIAFQQSDMRQLEVARISGQLAVLTFDDGPYGADGIIEGRELPSGKLRFRLEHGGLKINSVDVFDAKLICCGDDHLWIWDLSEKPQKNEWDVPFDSPLIGVTFLSPKEVFAVGKKHLSSFDLATELWLKTADLPIEISAFAVHEKQQLVAIGDAVGRIELRSCTRPDEVLATWRAHDGVRITVIEFDEQGQQLVTGASDGTLVVWSDLRS